MQFFCRARCSAAPATAWGLAVYTSDGSRSHTRGPQSTSQGDNNTQVVEVGWAGTTCRWRLQSWFWPGGVQHLPLFAPRDDDLLLLWSSCTACGGDTVCWRKHFWYSNPAYCWEYWETLTAAKFGFTESWRALIWWEPTGRGWGLLLHVCPELTFAHLYFINCKAVLLQYFSYLNVEQEDVHVTQPDIFDSIDNCQQSDVNTIQSIGEL